MSQLNEFPHRPTEAITDLTALSGNFRSIKDHLGDSIQYMAVVKANAYGHGAVECSRQLEKDGVDWFAVALAEEAIELRDAGITKPILCLGGVWPGQAEILIRNNITPTMFNVETAELINSVAKELNVVVKVHVKIDTGMGRIGILPSELDSFFDRMTQLPYIKIDGLMTHFAAADDPEERDFTQEQLAVFKQAVELAASKGIAPTYIDAANSPGTFVYPESRLGMVRLGGILYDLTDDILPAGTNKPKLKPVLSLITRISQLKQVKKGSTLGYGRTYTAERDMIVAAVPIGYNDGYKRGLSNKAKSIVNRQYVNVVGRVSMDWTLLDVTDVSDVKLGEKVVLIGSDGDCKIRTEELSQMLGTISYEITCGLSSRITRKYI